MSDTSKKTDQEKGDDVLRHLLKTPPDPKTGRDGKPKKEESMSFIQREIDRIRTTLVSGRGRDAELYVAQQALEWV
ncbi:hypothetical protein [Hoeflea sp.]|uniref:hypothetical protein n=1 Tax=Hoeflea sp. TaxID=1940281 RepID=UPI003BB02DAB